MVRGRVELRHALLVSGGGLHCSLRGAVTVHPPAGVGRRPSACKGTEKVSRLAMQERNTAQWPA
jgi:hypothetical protein